MSQIKRWLDMNDRLTELPDTVQDDPRVIDEEGRSRDRSMVINTPDWKNSVSPTTSSEEETF